ncbi:MAG: 4Fe-4S dicluster domain-containing protein [Nitrospinae bacterium]|nr:4Fe-4S dicluster domain-containing protein [Nitrospinota bacterium]
MVNEKEKKGLNRNEFLKLSAIGTTVIAGTNIGGDILTATERTEDIETAKKVGRRWAFIIDLDRCIGCKACAIACKVEFDTRLGLFMSQVIYYEYGEYPNTKRNFLPWLCNHCEYPPCINGCPVEPIDAEFNGIRFKKKATYKRPDGVVMVDEDRCIGCGLCIQNCPYNVRFFDPEKKGGANPDTNHASKCDLCVHILDAGVVPCCVNTCPARARLIGDLNDPNSEVSRLLKRDKAEVLLPEKGTKPHVFYIGKYKKRINKGLKKGEDIRIEANSEYQIKVWKEGPYYKGTL